MDQQDHALDIASLGQQLMEQLATVNSSTVMLGGGSPPCTIIAKVDDPTRNIDPGEYDPHYVSIGPYHRMSKPHLARDNNKISSLGAVLSAASPSMTVEDFLNELAHLEGRARSCYANKIDLSSNDFVRMLLLDGCYILARFGDVHGPRTNDAATANHVQQGGCHIVPSVSAAGGGDKKEDGRVVRDMLYLAENQIPFFVVEKIRQLTNLDGKVPTVNVIARHVRDLLRRRQYSVATPAMEATPGPGNLLHLLHMHLKPTERLSATGGSGTAGKPVGRWRRATEYYFAGVEFKSRAISTNGAVRNILDVKLSSGGSTLEVPCLDIDNDTWALLRNLMALEQCNLEKAGSHVTAYCIFMSQVACTPRDVELLSRKGVIDHALGNDNEVAHWFADLCKGVVFDADDPYSNYLRATCQALEKRFRNRWQLWMAWLRQKYFSNPWLAIGLVAATIGLACSVVQAVYTVLSYKQSPN